MNTAKLLNSDLKGANRRSSHRKPQNPETLRFIAKARNPEPSTTGTAQGPAWTLTFGGLTAAECPACSKRHSTSRSQRKTCRRTHNMQNSKVAVFQLPLCCRPKTTTTVGGMLHAYSAEGTKGYNVPPSLGDTSSGCFGTSRTRGGTTTGVFLKCCMPMVAYAQLSKGFLAICSQAHAHA